MRTKLTLIFILAAASAWSGNREIIGADKATCPFKGGNVFEDTSEKLRSLGEGIPGLAIVEYINPRRILREEARQRRLENDLSGEREIRQHADKREKDLSVKRADERAGMAIVEWLEPRRIRERAKRRRLERGLDDEKHLLKYMRIKETTSKDR